MQLQVGSQDQPNQRGCRRCMHGAVMSLSTARHSAESSVVSMCLGPPCDISTPLCADQVAHQVNAHLNSEVERLTLAVDALEQVRGTAGQSACCIHTMPASICCSMPWPPDAVP